MGPVEASIETVRVLIRQIQGLGILVPDRIGLAEGAVYAALVLRRRRGSRGPCAP